MFIQVQRTDTLPEMRALVNSAHIVAAMPSGGGIRTKIYLATGESWEVSLPFSRITTLLREEPQQRAAGPVMVEPVTGQEGRGA